MLCFHADYLITVQNEAGHEGLKMDLTAAVYDGVADVLDYTWQAVCAYVRMGIGQYCRAGAMLAEYVQYAVCAAAFLAAGVELAVRVCAGYALAKTVV